LSASSRITPHAPRPTPHASPLSHSLRNGTTTWIVDKSDRLLLTAAPQVLRRWLGRRLRIESAFTGTAAIFCFLVGSATLAATFYASYGFILFLYAEAIGATHLLLDRGQPPNRVTVSILAASAIVLLFVAFFMKHKVASREFAGPSSRSAKLAQGASTVLLGILFVSPQFFALSYEFLVRASGLLRINSELCAQILALLASHQARVSFTAIAGALNLRSPAQAFREITLIDGVVYLGSEPSGLSLTEDLRKELVAVIGVANLPFRLPEYLACPACGFLCRIEPAVEDRVRCPGCGTNYHLRVDSQGRFFFEPAVPPEPAPNLDDEFTWCCWVLGLPAHATMEDAKAAYRKLIKENHPDRVFGLGAEIEQLAAEKSKEINKAWETFTTHFAERSAAADCGTR
jgi:DnaJ domain